MKSFKIEELIRDAESLAKQDTDICHHYVWLGSEKFGQYSEYLFHEILLKALRMGLPDIKLLTLFCHPEGIGGLAIAPYAGVFLLLTVEPEKIIFCSKKINKKDNIEYIKLTSTTGDFEPVQEFIKYFNIHENYVKPDEKPEMEIYAHSPDLDKDIEAFIIYKHVEKYHCLPVDL